MYIYLINNITNNHYKIGYTTKHPSDRLLELQTGNSNKLELITFYETKNYIKLETRLHQHFKDKKILNEWFELNKEDIDNFLLTCIKQDEIINVLKENYFSKD